MIDTATYADVARAAYDWRNGIEGNRLLAALEEEASIAAAESGADREPGYDITRFAENWIDSWLAEHREPPAVLAHRILRLLYDTTESWEYRNIGSEAAYLVMGILTPVEPDKKVMWILSDGVETRHDEILRLLRENTNPWDPVWDHIIVVK